MKDILDPVDCPVCQAQVFFEMMTNNQSSRNAYCKCQAYTIYFGESLVAEIYSLHKDYEICVDKWKNNENYFVIVKKREGERNRFRTVSQSK